MITAVAFILWFQGVTQVSGSIAAIFTGVAPINTVVLSYAILQEPFQWAHVWGGLCVLVGIGFIVKDSRKESKIIVASMIETAHTVAAQKTKVAE